jgi:hypothetical protein
VKYGLAPVIPLALAMLGIACGGPSEEEQRQQAREEREYRQDLREYRQDVRQLQRERAEYRRCIAALGDLKDALDALDSRLAVGLNYDEYGTEVGDIVVVYDNSDLTGLGHECLQRVGLKLERALQEYRKRSERGTSASTTSTAISTGLRRRSSPTGIGQARLCSPPTSA